MLWKALMEPLRSWAMMKLKPATSKLSQSPALGSLILWVMSCHLREKMARLSSSYISWEVYQPEGRARMGALSSAGLEW